MTAGRAGHLKKKFLEAFRYSGNVTSACDKSGVARSTVYFWQEHDDQFAAGYREAEIEATERLEEVAQKRAVRQSDTLLIFLLKARAPEKYREGVNVYQPDQPRVKALPLDAVGAV